MEIGFISNHKAKEIVISTGGKIYVYRNIGRVNKMVVNDKSGTEEDD